MVVAYFVLTLGIALWISKRSSQSRSSTQYFLAGRNEGWFIVGASLFASNIGAEHLVGLAGTGAASGVAVAQFEVLASLILLVLGWVFVPFYMPYISPPIAAVFLIGIIWPRANAQGALSALLVGFVLGMGRLVLEMNAARLSGVWRTVATENFLHIAVALFLLCHWYS